MKTCGIYCITDLTGRIYIGSSSNCEERWKGHLRSLKKEKHINKKIRDYFKKYNESGFSFSIIEVCIKSELLIREQFYIDTLHPWYNVNLIADKPPSWRGKKHSVETIEKFKIVNKRKHTPETIAKLIAYRNSKEGRLQQKINSSKRRDFIGHPQSEKQKTALFMANKGKVLSEETRKKISIARTGTKMSDSAKENMRIAQTGRRHPPESIEKMRQKAKISWLDPIRRAKGIINLKILSLAKIKCR